MSISPLRMTLNPKLDAALQTGGGSWQAAAREAGPARVTAWIRARMGEEGGSVPLDDAVADLLEAREPEHLLFARAELAELLDETDDALADLLWELNLIEGGEIGDADVVFEATEQLATIAERYDDPLAAAEYWIEFLNWRRGPERGSDPDHVLTAFDEVIRLAELDGAPTAAATFGFKQAAFARLAEREDDRASTGDWEREAAAYEAWS